MPYTARCGPICQSVIVWHHMALTRPIHSATDTNVHNGKVSTGKASWSNYTDDQARSHRFLEASMQAPRPEMGIKNGENDRARSG